MIVLILIFIDIVRIIVARPSYRGAGRKVLGEVLGDGQRTFSEPVNCLGHACSVRTDGLCVDI